MFTLAVLILGMASGSNASDTAAWQKLQRGMSPEQVEQIVGVPLLRNAARGHQLWIYDAGGSAQFHGAALSAWTPPTPSAPSPAPKPPAKSSAQRSPEISAVAAI